MKSKKILYLEKTLRFMAKAVLKKHKPKIVAITGSVGKTSTKAAVFAVLSSKFNVRENEKNYNNEIGIPLTIIGAESGQQNVFKWIWVFMKWLLVLISSKYPEILVLELGVDRPADMKYFMSFIHPEIGIVTNVSFSHIEFFNTVDNIAKEKGGLVEAIDGRGFAILNADDERVLGMKEKTLAQVITFGLSESATVSASNVLYNYDSTGKPEGISFKLNYDGKNIPIRLRNLLPAHYVYVALAAAAVGITFKINLVDIASALEPLAAPAGRMNLIEGINGSYVIDDTYNASPISTLAAIDVLSSLEAKRKVVVLGDMLELGTQTEIGHREIGKKIFASKINRVFLVGQRMKFAMAELVSFGYPSSEISHFDNPYIAAQKVAEMIKEGDFVLVKGSQGMRMEKIVEQIIAKPEQAQQLLCRQSPEWKKRLFMNP
jgi:UDP-N-acetylmuramoyl-tripeptide--D-alanyl-D-alanine ligase